MSGGHVKLTQLCARVVSDSSALRHLTDHVGRQGGGSYSDGQ